MLYVNLRGVHFIRHSACERDLYVFRNHPYKKFVDLFSLSQSFRNHECKTLSKNDDSETHTNLSQEICLIKWTRPV